LEERSSEIDEVKELLKKERAERGGRITFTTSVGITATRFTIARPSRVATFPRMGTIVRQHRITTWAGLRQTRNDV
jgi:hypothetical protein